ncbi:FHA domain-containing protein [Streptomyces sp. NPDC060194]|uniref:FHA domain-containing protein n=1 Tax=Streptomyces sp. NPDC060194 TaxID=3347069 RepID=UPI0036649DF9
MPTCPNGHQSGADDWCEVCGHRMAPSGATPPPPYGNQNQGYGYPPQQAGPPSAEYCPQCHTPREALAPYCEECRWNFLTNSATPYPGGQRPGTQGGYPGPGQGQGQQGGYQQSRDPYEYQASRPSQVNRPAEALHQEPSYAQRQPAPGGPSYGGRDGGAQGYQQGGGPQGYPQGQQGYDNRQQGPGQGGQGPGGGDWTLQPPGGGPQGQGAPGLQGYPQGGGNWSVTVETDRDYFRSMMHRSGPEATSLNLPAYSPEQQRNLAGNQFTIGRRRHSTGDTPDIDLSVPPEDPGVSHQHAVLVQQPDGSWAVVDQNSTNGTTVNGGEDPIQPFVPVPLQDGDKVHVGAWTTITIHRS